MEVHIFCSDAESVDFLATVLGDEDERQASCSDNVYVRTELGLSCLILDESLAINNGSFDLHEPMKCKREL